MKKNVSNCAKFCIANGISIMEFELRHKYFKFLISNNPSGILLNNGLLRIFKYSK